MSSIAIHLHSAVGRSSRKPFHKLPDALSCALFRTAAALLLVLLSACSSEQPSAVDESGAQAEVENGYLNGTPGINWFEGDVDTAFTHAKAERKPLFLYWGAEWCPYCKQVKATVFTRRDVIDRTRHFVAVALDGDDPAAQRAGEEFGVMGYPTMIIYSPDGEELTRIPNGLDLDAYAGVFDLAMDAVRPVAGSVAAVLAGDTLDDDEWRRLAVYSWGQDNARALGERSVRETFKVLSEACPRHVASACTRLELSHLEAAIDEAGDTQLDTTTKTRALGVLNAMLADEQLITANLDAVLHGGGAFVGAVTEPGSAMRTALVNRWESVALGLADDARLSTVDQFYASYVPIEFLRMDDAEAGIPEATRVAIRERVADALARTADPVERHPVVTTGASLLRAADLPGEAATMLEAELAASKQPYYLMSALASTAASEGDNATALMWRKRAYETASGESTRFRWGYGYVSEMLRLSPEAVDDIETATAAIFTEFDDPATAFYGGTHSRVAQLDEKLKAWADTPEKVEVLVRLRTRIDSVCARIPSGDKGRSRCDAFLAASSG
ncbi:MAG: thioredoxin family protein [Pseudomonadota bacterium]